MPVSHLSIRYELNVTTNTLFLSLAHIGKIGKE